MDDFLKMDVFFGVTTVAVVVLAVLLAIVLVRLIRILKRVEHVSELVEQEGEQLKEDIDRARTRVREEGFRIGHVLGFFQGAKKPRRRARKS